MGRRGAWALSGLVAERCGDRRRAGLHANAWLELVAGLGQVDTAGEAVLCLVPPRPPLRLLAVMGAVAILLAVVLVILGVLWWPAAVVLLSAAGLVGGAGALNLWRCRQVGSVSARPIPPGPGAFGTSPPPAPARVGHSCTRCVPRPTGRPGSSTSTLRRHSWSSTTPAQVSRWRPPRSCAGVAGTFGSTAWSAGPAEGSGVRSGPGVRGCVRGGRPRPAARARRRRSA